MTPPSLAALEALGGVPGVPVNPHPRRAGRVREIAWALSTRGRLFITADPDSERWAVFPSRAVALRHRTSKHEVTRRVEIRELAAPKRRAKGR